MLVLTRLVGQKILIGDDIIITLVKTQDGRARIGITAPKGVKIEREEMRAAAPAKPAEAAP